MNKEPVSIETLVKKAKKRDESAFIELLSQHQDYLYRIAYTYYKNEQYALDAVSECVAKVYINLPKLKKPEYFKTWITRILINEVLNEISKQNRWTSLDKVDEHKILYENEKVNQLSKEEKMDLYNAIDLLPSDYRKVVILKYFQELKTKEIADIMKIPEGTVKTLLHRSRNKLRIILMEDM